MRNGPWRWMVLVVAGVLVAGCGGDGTEPVPGAREGEEAAAADSQSPEGLRRINGLCVMGHEVRTFLPCGSKKVYWIQTDQLSLERLQTAVENFTDEPFEPFFAIVEGRLSSEVGEGFAADYDGQITIERLIRLAPANELDCES